jgi:hypothetical protein
LTTNNPNENDITAVLARQPFLYLQTMKFKWRKWNRNIHRDLGYFFVAMSLIYAISGIAINHMHDWNPNYDIDVLEFQVNVSQELNPVNKENVLKLLAKYGEEDNYKNHYVQSSGKLKVFLRGGGDLVMNLRTGNGIIEHARKRAVLHALNYLHYNPGNWWLWFSDFFAVSLIFLAISGMFILKGKNGIKGRGAILVIAGIIIPVLFLILFYH